MIAGALELQMTLGMLGRRNRFDKYFDPT